MNFESMSNEAIQEEIGARLQRIRLDRDLTQSAMAEKSGIALRTLRAAEDGQGFHIDTLISILRALELLPRIDQFLPEPLPSPIQLARLKGHQRKRASRKPKVEPAKTNTWTWGE